MILSRFRKCYLDKAISLDYNKNTAQNVVLYLSHRELLAARLQTFNPAEIVWRGESARGALSYREFRFTKNNPS